MSLARLLHGPWVPEIFPLAAPAGALLLGDLPLRALQERAAGAAALAVADTPSTVALPAGTRAACTEDAIFSSATLRTLLHHATTRGHLVQATIRAGTPLWHAATRLSPVAGDLPLPLWAGPLEGLSPNIQGEAEEAFPQAERIAICDEDTSVDVRVPPHGRAPHLLQIPCVHRLGGRVRHWLHVLDLSLSALQTRRLEQGLLASDTTRARNRLGDVDIHPTAVVMGSILEDGVKVEAHASVIDCAIGKDVLVADHSVLHTCVIGDGCRTLVDTSLRRVVAMPGSTLSNLGLSDVVIGEGVFLTTAVATFAGAPGTDAVVDGQDTGRAVLGGAIGARCILGTRALLAAGVALPPGLLVVARPGEAVVKLDAASLERAHMMRGRPREHA